MNLKTLAFWVLMGCSGIISAEGGCPPGQYPYDTPQARQCVPIPGQEDAATSQPLVVFEERWGAIVADTSTGDIGVASGEASKRKAKEVAMQRCSVDGATGCKLQGTFSNQCAAIARREGYQGYGYATSETGAQDQALERCGSSAVCKIAWSDCSLPVRIQ
jgi:hypothetical protein